VRGRPKDPYTHIVGVQFIVLPKAGHSINWEQPEAFNRNVLEFTQALANSGAKIGVLINMNAK
jgi:pimeloyl-ACP methyl ester carboxylesterase